MQWEKVRKPTDYIDSITENFRSRGGHPQLSISSLPVFDRVIWGLKTKELVVIGARTSQGKSSFVNQICLDFAKQGNPVLYLSLEMGVEEIIERMFCNVMGVDNFDLICGRYKSNPGISKKWAEFCMELVEMKMLITCGIGSTFEELLELVENINPTPKVVVIDYIGCISVKNREMREMMNEYIRQFRQLAIEKDFCGILVSQVNRGSDGKEPSLGQLKETGVLEEHSDKCILLYFDRDKEEERQYKIILAKNRNGRTGEHYVKFIPQYYQFREFDRERQDVSKNITTEKHSDETQQFRQHTMGESWE